MRFGGSGFTCQYDVHRVGDVADMISAGLVIDVL